MSLEGKYDRNIEGNILRLVFFSLPLTVIGFFSPYRDFDPLTILQFEPYSIISALGLFIGSAVTVNNLIPQNEILHSTIVSSLTVGSIVAGGVFLTTTNVPFTIASGLFGLASNYCYRRYIFNESEIY